MAKKVQLGPQLGEGPGTIDFWVDTMVINTVSHHLEADNVFANARKQGGSKFIVTIRQFKRHYIIYFERARRERMERLLNGTYAPGVNPHV